MRSLPHAGADETSDAASDELSDELADQLIGQLIGDRYRVLRKLGQGGMGAVYLAEHELVGKKVAIKVLSEELTGDRAAVQRFIQEARATARIQHRHIVDVHDLGVSGDVVFIAMEYLEGEDLYQTVQREGRLPPSRVREILQQVARGLGAAHAAGIVHRDLKPENIRMVTRPDEGDLVKLVDFGLAKLLDRVPASRERLTRAGTVIGTPEYMSPEQVSGQPIDHRSDIYSLGCIVYELLLGKPPFHADRVMDLMGMHLFAPPPEMPPEVPADLAYIVNRCMQKEPPQRFQSVEELLTTLGESSLPAAPKSSPSLRGALAVEAPGPLSSAPQAAMAGAPAFGAPAAAPAPLPSVAAGQQAMAGAAQAASASGPQVATPAPARRLALLFAGAALAPLLAGAVVFLARRPAAPALASAPPAAATPRPQIEAAAPPWAAAAPSVAAAPPADAPSALTATARVMVRGTAGATVLLNGKQRIGQIPVDVAVPMLQGLNRESSELVIRRRGCIPLSIGVVLTPGGQIDEDGTLRCTGVGRARGVTDRRVSRRTVAAKQAPAAAAPAAPPRPASPAGGNPLRNPFGG